MHYEAWHNAEEALSQDQTDPNAHKWQVFSSRAVLKSQISRERQSKTAFSKKQIQHILHSNVCSSTVILKKKKNIYIYIYVDSATYFRRLHNRCALLYCLRTIFGLKYSIFNRRDFMCHLTFSELIELITPGISYLPNNHILTCIIYSGTL